MKKKIEEICGDTGSVEYIPDIFYHIEDLEQTDRLTLISEAMEMSDDIIVDKIIGWQRQVQKDDDPQEWIKNTLKPDSIYRFIHRRGYSNPYHLQVVIRESGDFLWINLNEDQVQYFVEKYKLKILS